MIEKTAVSCCWVYLVLLLKQKHDSWHPNAHQHFTARERDALTFMPEVRSGLNFKRGSFGFGPDQIVFVYSSKIQEIDNKFITFRWLSGKPLAYYRCTYVVRIWCVHVCLYLFAQRFVRFMDKLEISQEKAVGGFLNFLRISQLLVLLPDCHMVSNFRNLLINLWLMIGQRVAQPSLLGSPWIEEFFVWFTRIHIGHNGVVHPHVQLPWARKVWSSRTWLEKSTEWVLWPKTCSGSGSSGVESCFSTAM